MTHEPTNHLPTNPAPFFPWKHVLITALAVLAVVGLIILIRKGGSGALAATAPAVALGVARAHQSRSTHRAQQKEPIDMEFLKAQLREGACQKASVTPTQLKRVLNGLFEEHNLAPPFDSEQHMAKVLLPLGLRSIVRTVPGRSERRWYDLSNFGTHEAPAL
jgi:hypothetical protein